MNTRSIARQRGREPPAGGARARAGFAAGMLLPWLAACSSAPTQVYTLAAIAPAAVVAGYAGPPLRVDAVHVPPALDRIEMVSPVASDELQIDDSRHWSAPPGELSRQALTADLIARLPPGRVIFPHLAKPAGALGVDVDLLQFELDAQGARLQAAWAVTADGTHADRGGGSAVLRTGRSGAGGAATAQALSTLLAQLADRIVAGLSAAVP
jgi:uncharacterized lipoprotein YmbA